MAIGRKRGLLSFVPHGHRASGAAGRFRAVSHRCLSVAGSASGDPAAGPAAASTDYDAHRTGLRQKLANRYSSIVDKYADALEKTQTRQEQQRLVAETEQFVYYLVLCNNLSAATTLIIQSSAVLSNQVWSLIASKAAELSHYPAACLVFNQVMDTTNPYSEYIDSDSCPYLVSLQQLEALALVFKHNHDAVRVHGVLAYFKKYYSYAGHHSTFMNLRLALIEVYSIQGDLDLALLQLDKLYHYLARNITLHSAKHTMENVYTNFRLRRVAIRENISPPSASGEDRDRPFDLNEARVAESAGSLPFRPSLERNNYTQPNKPFAPILFHKFLAQDLPELYYLIDANVMKLMNHDMDGSAASTSSTSAADGVISFGTKLETIINFVGASTPLTQIFVYKSLCENGYIRQAYLILMKTADMDLWLTNIQLDIYKIFLRAIIKCSSGTLSSPQVTDMCMALLKFPLQKRDIDTAYLRQYPEVLQLYLEAILTKADASRESMQPFLDDYTRNPKSIDLYLNPLAYDKFTQIFQKRYAFVKPLFRTPKRN